jgi:putative selenium metabolism hydrolase
LAAIRPRFQPYRDDLIAFAQRLVQTPSLPGQEGDVAVLVQREMSELGYDDVWVDRVGNVVGLVRGVSAAQSMMLNAHMDHVAIGDEAAWPHPPFAGHIVDGQLWGRAAMDLKGSLASMIYAAGALRREGFTLPWDVYVAAVVFEEQGGLGTEVLFERLHPQFCVIGEATGNQLALAHRGKIGMVVETTGRAVHASMVDLGINPHFSVARFLLNLRNLTHVHDPILGRSTVAPTIYRTDQSSDNVIPGQVRLILDWRSVPGETPDSVCTQVQQMLQASLEPGAHGVVHLRSYDNVTYTGLRITTPAGKIAVKLDPESDLARRSRQALQQALGRAVDEIVWKFCTDGSVCADKGTPIIGFGPGDQELAHTAMERVPLADLFEAMVGNAALALSPTVPLSRLSSER